MLQRERIHFWLVLLIAMFQANFCLAQQTLPGVLKQLRDANVSSKISYDYVVYLNDLSTNRPVDSVKGHLYKDKRQYVDSSGNAFAAMDGNYFCKLDHHKKTASVYNVVLLQKKLHLLLNEDVPVLVIPDSIIVKEGIIKVDNSNSEFYLLQVSFPGHAMSGIRVEIQKSNYVIRSIAFETDEQNADGQMAGYRKIYKLYNIRYELHPEIFNLSRVFSVANNKVVLSKQYAAYRLKTINY